MMRAALRAAYAREHRCKRCGTPDPWTPSRPHIPFVPVAAGGPRGRGWPSNMPRVNARGLSVTAVAALA